MTALPIDRLGMADVAGCLALSTEAGWNQVATDWDWIIAAGETYGVRGPDRLIASAAMLPYPPHFAWICMVLVTRAEQRRGHAMRLTRHCHNLASARGLVAGLDATSAGRAVYLKLGFEDVYPISRLTGLPARWTALSSIAIEPLHAHLLPEIMSYDRKAFGGDRSVLLSSLWGTLSEAALVARRNGTLAGYVLARKGRFATQLGPMVAETPDVAMALAAYAFDVLPGPMVVDVPDHQSAFMQWLSERGFIRQRGFMRMLHGRREPLDAPDFIMAITGPEFA